MAVLPLPFVGTSQRSMAFVYGPRQDVEGREYALHYYRDGQGNP